MGTRLRREWNRTALFVVFLYDPIHSGTTLSAS